MLHQQNASPDSREGEVPTGVEEEGCVTEALHDEVSIGDGYDEVFVVIVDNDKGDKDDTPQPRIFCFELPKSLWIVFQFD